VIRISPNILRPKTIQHRLAAGMKKQDELQKFKENFVSPQAKILAWFIFLYFFIESGTLGLLPKQVYYVYRNVRFSDLIMYGLIIYSFFRAKEFYEYYGSKLTIIIKILLFYFAFQFIVSTILYDFNTVEYFFRLKGLWASFMVFPYLLLMKRNGVTYLIKLILPVTIVSNILYILSSLTGIAFLPDIGIEKQNLPGGLQVYRVYGGTFFGDLFFLGFIFKWITDKFRFYQLGLVVLFVIPHILAFGRSAWIFFSFTIVTMFILNILRKKDFKILIRQSVLIGIFILAVIYSFNKLIPQATYLTDALEARVEQGKDDYAEEKGTYGSRLENIKALIDLWGSSNVVFGIGMHPMWVIRAVTEEEKIYVWGFSDVKWASVLAAYGISGIAIAAFFQIFFFIIALKVLKNKKNMDLFVFFSTVLISQLMFDSLINYTYNLFTLGLLGMSTSVSFCTAALIYSYENIKRSSRNN
jgi:hypothetical protein